MNQPLAYVHPGAKIAKNVVVEPFTTISNNVEIGEGTWVGSNVTIMEGARIGNNCYIYPGSVISAIPQDLKFEGEDSLCQIGNNTTIRECVTINKATNEGEKTIIGNNNLLMAYTHIGHNCELGNRIVLSNSVQIAGHVIVEDKAIIGGCLGIHQFVHIGFLAMVGGMTRVDRDVPPFCLAEGHPGKLRGLNRVGIKRSGLLNNKEFDLKLLQKN